MYSAEREDNSNFRAFGTSGWPTELLTHLVTRFLTIRAIRNTHNIVKIFFEPLMRVEPNPFDGQLVSPTTVGMHSEWRGNAWGNYIGKFSLEWRSNLFIKLVWFHKNVCRKHFYQYFNGWAKLPMVCHFRGPDHSVLDKKVCATSLISSVSGTSWRPKSS